MYACLVGVDGESFSSNLHIEQGGGGNKKSPAFVFPNTTTSSTWF